MQALTFRDTQFDITDHNGQPWLQGAQIASALGYASEDAVSRIYRRNADEFTPCMTETVKLTVSGNLQKEVRIFSLRGAHLLAMFARTEVAKEFRRWVLDVLDGQAEVPAPRKVRKPKALPNGLTGEQQGAIKALVSARIETLPEAARGRAATLCWSALKSKFGCSYKEIAPEQFTEAVSLVARVVLDGELLEPEAPKVVGRLPIDFPIRRWLTENPWIARRQQLVRQDQLVVSADMLYGMDVRSPTLQLLTELEKADYNVSACRVELLSMRHHLEMSRRFFRDIQSISESAQEHGLRLKVGEPKG